MEIAGGKDAPWSAEWVQRDGTVGGPVGEFKGWVQWGVHWVSPKGGYSGGFTRWVQRDRTVGGSTEWVQREGTVGGAHWVGAKEGYSGEVHQESPKRRYGGGGVHLRWVHKRKRASKLKKNSVFGPLSKIPGSSLVAPWCWCKFWS